MNFDNIRRRVEAAPPLIPSLSQSHRRKPDTGPAPKRALILVSSTGGPPALQTILQALPKEWDLPVFIAQHMPPVFTRMFAERLNSLCEIEVVEAGDHSRPRRGTAYVAPGDGHMVFTAKGMIFIDKEADYRYRPSADALLASAAEVYSSKALGVVLTGMGDDGSKGAKVLAEAGSPIIGESKETAVIFGMPKEVIQRGLATQVLPLHDIANAIVYWWENGELPTLKTGDKI